MKRVTYEEHNVEYSAQYQFVDMEGESQIEVAKWERNGFDVELPARIEDKLIALAYKAKHSGECTDMEPPEYDGEPSPSFAERCERVAPR
jgi:hypothetical protein